MGKIKLALLSGGVSSERQVSLNSGKQVFKALDKDKYEISFYDPKIDLKQLVIDSDKIDVALIILHGPFGEDGTIQGLLDLLNIPYQGAGVLGSSVAMNKLISKHLYEKKAIPTPSYFSFSINEYIDLSLIIEKLGLPLVVKPTCAGSSQGMSLVKNELEFKEAISLGFKNDDTIIIEKYIKGVEITCGVLGNDKIFALPIIEIVPDKEYEYFDYEAKYKQGATREICPARIDKSIADQVQKFAIQAHKALFLKGYSRTDMIIDDGKIFVLETNTIPGMTKTSLYPQSAEKAGYSFTALLDELISLAIDENKKQNLRRAK